MQPTTRRLAAAALALTLGCAVAAPARASPDDALNRYYAATAQDPAAALRQLEADAAAWPGDIRLPLELGYALLRQDRQADALPWFEKAVAIDPRRADVWKQIGYIRKALHRRGAALAAFERALAIDPGDVAAQRERAFLLGEGPGGRAGKRTFAELYAAPEYNSHWDMGVFPLQARVGTALDGAGRIEGYAGVRINADTRSGNGAFGPQTYTDNAAVVAVGLRVKPIEGVPVTLFVEGGAAYDLTDRNRDRWRGDVRGGFYLYTDWNMAPATGTARGGVRPIVDVYADGIYYSRYGDNVLFYGRVRPGLRLVESDAVALDAYALGAAGFDTKGLDDNRFAELGGGAALRLFGAGGLTLRAEGLRVFRSGALADYSTARVRVEYFGRF